MRDTIIECGSALSEIELMFSRLRFSKNGFAITLQSLIVMYAIHYLIYKCILFISYLLNKILIYIIPWEGVEVKQPREARNLTL